LFPIAILYKGMHGSTKNKQMKIKTKSKNKNRNNTTKSLKQIEKNKNYKPNKKYLLIST